MESSGEHTREFSRRRLLGAAGIVSAGAAVPAIFATDCAAATDSKAMGAFGLGANLSGLETGSAIPGRPRTDYAVPAHSDLDFLNARGLNTVRLPFKWRRMQPVIGGGLDSSYLALVTDLVAYAASLDMGVILDVHSFGGYGSDKIGGGKVTTDHFADLWRRLAAVFTGTAGVAGYDLMNEPSNMPSASVWPKAAQAAIDAVRTADHDTPIIVEGDHGRPPPVGSR